MVAVVKGEIEIAVDQLPEGALALIKGALSLPNEERETQAREQVHGWWDLPETIDLWRIEDRLSGSNVLCLPRGFAGKLVEGVRNFGGQVEWDDQRVAPEAAAGYFPLPPFVPEKWEHQLEAVKDMMTAEQGFLQIPGGGGKTNAMLLLMTYRPLRSLVIMDKADIVDQWRERAHEFLGLELDFDDDRSVGKIGMNVWEERDLTIALRQTLWARIDELDATDWWKQWGRTIYDEGHHLAADTLSEVSRRCISLEMLGCSATPARTPIKGRVVEAIIGPVVHRTSREVLRERGILIKPELLRVETGFEADFWETHQSRPDGKCDVPNCPKAKNGKKHKHRNNYQSILKKLKEDPARNAQIGKQIVSERDHIHLLYARHLNYLDVLKKAIENAGWDGPIFYLRGEENARKESRGIVAEIIDSREAVILSTVADEALDVPPIDRIQLVWPMRQSALTEQIVGRGERACEGKDSSVVVDYVDSGCEVLLGQSIERCATWSRLGLV